MTELSTLERKPLSDLHQIAAQLGIEQYRKYRKPALAELIYKTATEQAVGQTVTEPAETHLDPFGDADTAPMPTERRREEPPRGRERPEKGYRRQDGRQERDGRQRDGQQAQSGILDVLPDGFGFLRTNGYSQGKGDVYVSTSQIKRFNLRRGDLVVGQIRPARDGEKYPALVRIESVNGHEPQKGQYRTNFDDLTPLYPMDRLRLEWKPNDIAPRVVDLVAPIGKG